MNRTSIIALPGQRSTTGCQGFTLIELMIVVAVIGILAAIAVPNFMAYRERANVATVIANLKTFGDAFGTYAIYNDDFPPDSHLPPPYHLPPGAGMEEYLNEKTWAAPTPLGGFYNWEGPDNYPYAGISLFNTTAPLRVIEMLDRLLDDGDLTTGNFRETPNGRYTYILQE